MEGLLLLVGGYLGWAVGANDGANCVGTSVGARLLSPRRAMAWVAVFALIGALVGGRNVVVTVGTGIVTEGPSPLALLLAMGVVGLCVTSATLLRLPVSTSQAVVGALAGLGWAVGAEVDVRLLTGMIAVWGLSPLLAGGLATLLYRLGAAILPRLRRSGVADRLLVWVTLASGGYAAFALGANNLGNAVGPLAHLDFPLFPLILWGGLTIAAGALTFGYRVTQTIAYELAPIDPLGAFAVQLGIALSGHLFAFVGIPVSFSHMVVGALLGVRLAKGLSVLRPTARTVRSILLGWVSVPAASGLLVFLLYKLVEWI